MKKIKICHVIGNFVNGGVESVIYNYFSNINLDMYEVHIIGHGIRVQECADRFINMGFIIHNITPKSVSLLKNVKEMEAIFKKYEFDVVHSHLTEWACVPMFLAWKCGVKVRINHSHMAEKPQGLKNKIYYGVRLYFGKLFSTDYFACGRDAGIYLFGKKDVDSGKVIYLPNAVDYSKFKFSPERRQAMRKGENIENNTVVVGNVGRYFEQKNHHFLIEVFNEFHKKRLNSVLVLLGDGELMESIKKQVRELKLENAVRFLGNRSDVADWYQVMDVFVLPSLYEGLPVVGVEAQATGLPCLFSNGITPEIQISPNALFMDLEDGAVRWANTINEMVLCNNARDNVILDHDRYDIKKNAAILDQFYKERVSQISYKKIGKVRG